MKQTVTHEEDHLIVKKHSTQYGNVTYEVMEIKPSKQAAEAEIARNPEYKWRGNSTGSVGYSAVNRMKHEAEHGALT